MTTTSPYTKFAFDTEFFELVAGQPGTTTAATPAQLRAQIEESKQQAYDEGYTKGLAEGQTQSQSDLAQLQQHLQNTLLALQTVQTEREEALLTQVLSLMRVTLHHLIGQAVVHYGPELLEHHMRTLLPLLRVDEALTLRIHPSARGFHEKLGLPQAAIMGLPMHISADPALGITDAVVQWANGGAESKLAQHLEAVDVLLAGAGVHIMEITPRPNLGVMSEAPVASVQPMQQAVPQVSAAVPSLMPDLDEAEKAARARANALLGDDDDELIDALK